MNDEQLLRYSRQIMLPDMGIEGQRKLLQSKALIIGLGGLGSPIAMYLASSGVGQLTLVDDDQVDLSNLQRQIVHSSDSIGEDKVASAKARLLRLNPECHVVSVNRRLTGPALREQIQAADIVIDACDNFDTRFQVNAACVRTQTPLVSGAAIRWEGQVSVFDLRVDHSPCYRCLYQDQEELAERCSENGVISPLVGIIGSIQALEAIKVLINFGTTLTGKLLLLDGVNMEWRTLKLRKDPTCPVCGV